MKSDQLKSAARLSMMRKGIGVTLATVLVAAPLSPVGIQEALAAQTQSLIQAQSQGRLVTQLDAETQAKVIKVVKKLYKDKVADAAAIEKQLVKAGTTKKEFLDTPTKDLAQGDKDLVAAIDWVKEKLEDADKEGAADSQPSSGSVAETGSGASPSTNSNGSSDVSKEDDPSTSGTAQAGTGEDSTAAKDKDDQEAVHSTGSAEKDGAKSKSSAAKKTSKNESDKSKESTKSNNYPKWSYKGNNAFSIKRVSADLSTDKFVAMISEPARAVGQEYDVYASVLIAHAALQTKSGNSDVAQAPYHNLFALKADFGSAYGIGSGQSVKTYSSATRKSYESEDVMAARRTDASFPNLSAAETAQAHESILGGPLDAAAAADAAALIDSVTAPTLLDATDAAALTGVTAHIGTSALTDAAVLADASALARVSDGQSVSYAAGDGVFAAAAVGIADDVVEAEADAEMPLAATMAQTFKVRNGFRVYDSPLASLRDYADLISQGLLGLRKPITKQNLPTYQAACARLEADLGIEGYGDQLVKLIEAYGLARYDEPFDQQWSKTYSVVVSQEGADGKATTIQQRTAADLVSEATAHLGETYVWGGTTPGSFDCSGFVGYVYRHALGVELPRTTHYQCLLGKDVDFSDLRTGDLMFFVDDENVVDHVGMYLGEGCYIEASGSAGKVVITAIETKKPDFAKRVL